MRGVSPASARAMLLRCLSGELAPAAAIAGLFQIVESASTVRELIDSVTRHAAESSRSGDRLLQDRVDELTQVIVDPELGIDRLEKMQRGS